MATEHRYGHTFYAGLASPGPAADYTLTSCFANAAKKSSKCDIPPTRNRHARTLARAALRRGACALRQRALPPLSHSL
jgi:hypothetical protein